MNDGQFYPWFRGAQDLVKEATAQFAAAGDWPIHWQWTEPEARDAAAARFSSTDPAIAAAVVRQMATSLPLDQAVYGDADLFRGQKPSTIIPLLGYITYLGPKWIVPPDRCPSGVIVETVGSGHVVHLGIDGTPDAALVSRVVHWLRQTATAPPQDGTSHLASREMA